MKKAEHGNETHLLLNADDIICSIVGKCGFMTLINQGEKLLQPSIRVKEIRACPYTSESLLSSAEPRILAGSNQAPKELGSASNHTLYQ